MLWEIIDWARVALQERLKLLYLTGVLLPIDLPSGEELHCIFLARSMLLTGESPEAVAIPSRALQASRASASRGQMGIARSFVSSDCTVESYPSPAMYDTYSMYHSLRSLNRAYMYIMYFPACSHANNRTRESCRGP